MAIVVRLSDVEGRWTCTNRVAHITIGTRDNSVKPKESNDLLENWLQNGINERDGVSEITLAQGEPIIGEVKGVLSR